MEHMRNIVKRKIGKFFALLHQFPRLAFRANSRFHQRRGWRRKSAGLAVDSENREDGMLKNSNPTTEETRALRKAASSAERALWSVLKAKRLNGYRFTRRMPIGPYFADFACRARQLVIEVDSSKHLERAAQDRTRDEYLMREGYSVFRFASSTVLRDRGAVCESILAVLENRIEDFVEAPDPGYRRGFDRARRMER
jgi:very-short-patch-repair endonuclease